MGMSPVRRWGRRAGMALVTIAALFLGTLIFVVAVEAFWPRSTHHQPSDYVICLGGGKNPGPILNRSYERADTCASLANVDTSLSVFVSGRGAGSLMADRVLAKGIAPDRVDFEAKSRSTLQNALFTSAVVATDARIIVVTNAFHLPRSWMSFRAMGYRDVQLVSTPNRLFVPWFLVREAMAIWFNLARFMIWWATPWLDSDARDAILT